MEPITRPKSVSTEWLAKTVGAATVDEETFAPG
jgi:hypothetical protein